MASQIEAGSGDAPLAAITCPPASEYCDILSDANLTCQSISVAQLQAEILESSKEVALSWLPANATLNFTLLAIELVLVLTAVRLRHRRAIVRSGLGFVTTIVLGCVCGHIANLIDALPLADMEEGGMACRGRLVLLQLFISLLLFPICGKLVTRCRTMRTLNLSSTAGGGADWDRLARRIAFGTIAAQLLIVTVYLSVTARRDFSPSRLLTVCSEDVSEHVFHGLEVFVAVIVLIVAFLMLAYLELSRASKTQQVDGGKETLKTLLSLLSLAVITAGFAIIFTTSARDSGVTVLVPARLILVLTVALLNLCTQVLPPVLRAAHDKYKERRGGRARRGAVGKAAIDKLVRMQQAQLAQLEVDLAEKQRSLQENLLRLKLLSTPLRQEWCEVGVVPPKAGGDPRSPSSVPKWDKFFVRVFKNKKLVCWASMEDAETDRPPVRVVDLFEVEEVAAAERASAPTVAASGRDNTPPPLVAGGGSSGGVEIGRAPSIPPLIGLSPLHPPSIVLVMRHTSHAHGREHVHLRICSRDDHDSARETPRQASLPENDALATSDGGEAAAAAGKPVRGSLPLTAATLSHHPGNATPRVPGMHRRRSSAVSVRLRGDRTFGAV